MTRTPVLVFGPTGGVGSAAARRAASLGAHVHLAMRDATKPIPGLSSSEEASGPFTRVTADKTSPESIRAAVESSGAKSAFVYLVHGPDFLQVMRNALETLRDSGVERVVLLSSVTVEFFEPDITPGGGCTPAEIIPFIHAQVELVLRECFPGGKGVAVRPCMFASNLLHYAEDIRKDRAVRMPYPDYPADWIAPEDIGFAAAHFLVGGELADGGRRDSVVVAGPQVVTQGEAVKQIGRAVGREVVVERISADEAVRDMVASGMPEPLARYQMTFFERQEKGHGGPGAEFFTSDSYRAAAENTRKYAGQATTLAEWIEENKAAFA